MHKYTDIQRMREKFTNAFSLGEHIVVQTKIDGANASFTYDAATDTVVAFSRNTKLDENNNLRGFYDFVKTLDAAAVKKITHMGRYVIFGEWLVPHKVKYAEDKYNKFYMFDVWDTQIEQYLPYQEVSAMFVALSTAAFKTDKFNFVPVLYDGPFCSWEQLYEMLGCATIGGQPCEEGIIIKSQDRLNNKYSGTPSYVKIVNEAFAEIAKTKKPVDPEKIKEKEAEMQAAIKIATLVRIEKCLMKMIDESLIPEDWDETNMGTIMKNLPARVYEDCIKEELELVEQAPNFKKNCGRVVANVVKDLLNRQ